MIQLVKRARDGDMEAFLELMEQNSLSMYKVARAIVRNDEDAADAVQETILTCFQKIRTLRKPEFFKTWMIRILINECNGILRHYKKEEPEEEIQEPARQDRSLAEFEFKEMLNGVDEPYRTVLILYYVEGFRISEIGEILNMNENTVKTRLARARVQIKEMYSEDREIPDKKGAV